MKKFGFYVTALVAGVLASCSNVEEIQTPSNEMEDFVAVMAEGKSRTTLGGEEGKSVLWSDNDALAIFRASGKGYNTKYTLKTIADDGSATFSYAGVYSPMDGTAPSLSLEKNYAVYPYSNNITMTAAGVVDVTIPATQTYTANTFDANAAFMFAASDDQTLQFKNAHALLKIALTSMPGDTYSITSITLSSTVNALSGAATIGMENDEPKVTLSGTGQELTLNCGNNGVTVDNPETAVVFYLVVTPGTYSDLKLTLTGTGYSKELTLPASLTIARNNIVTVKYICGSDDFTGNIDDMLSTDDDINLNE